MKRAFQILLLIGVSLLVFVIACRKVNKSSSISQVTTVSLNELFKEFRSTPEVKCVTAGIAQTVTFSKGTRLSFYPNSFKDASGAIITSGTVCIEMIEMYKAGDMIANRSPTITTDGELLESAGEVYLNATKEGQKVYANKYGIAFKQQAASTQLMDLYYGDRNNFDSSTTWVKTSTINAGTTATGTKVDSLAGTPFYFFDSCVKLGFINGDRTYYYPRSTPRTEVKLINPDTSYNLWNTITFIVIPEINSVYNMRPYNYHSATHTYDLHGYTLPIGMEVIIVSISHKNSEYSYYEYHTAITDKMSVNLTIIKQSLDYIKTKLRAL